MIDPRIKELFKSNGLILKDKTSKREVDEEKFHMVCLKNGIDIRLSDRNKIYQQAVDELVPDNSVKNVAESLNLDEVFRGFVAKGNDHTGKIIYYDTASPIGILSLGSSLDLDSRNLYNIMKNKPSMSKVLDKWAQMLKPYSDTLKISTLDGKQVIETMWERLFTGPNAMKFEEIDFSQPPAILEGFGKGTQYTIPFTRKKSNLDDLHPILSDFLKRTSNHEYLCAIIATRLIGKFKHFIPWIEGPGGDGKSTFFAFLQKIIPNGSVELSLNNKETGLYEAIGKTFLIVPDTNHKNLFYYEDIKKISGGDAVVINGKYKHPQTMVLPGMILVSSNKNPSIGNFEFAKRRARVFHVTPGNFSGTDKELSVQDAANKMAQTTNEFLNYCVQCLETLGDIVQGNVPNLPPDPKTNQPTSFEHAFNDLLENNYLTITPEKTIVGSKLRAIVRKASQQEGDFFYEQFFEYLEGKHGVIFENGQYKGIGK